MSTRSVVGIPTDNGFEGRYVHWDGSPSTRLPLLLALVARDGLAKVRETVMAHEWSSLHVEDDGYGVAYEEEPYTWTRANFTTTDSTPIEWIYVLNDSGITVLEPEDADVVSRGHVGYTEPLSEEAVRVIECGEDYARCYHYAYHHLAAEMREVVGTLGMRQWLGLEPLGFRSIKSFRLPGRVLHPTGSGSSGTSLDPSAWTVSPRAPRYWWVTVAEDARALRAARMTKAGYKIAYDAVMPATAVAPEHVVPAGTVLATY